MPIKAAIPYGGFQSINHGFDPYDIYLFIYILIYYAAVELTEVNRNFSISVLILLKKILRRLNASTYAKL